MAAPIKLPIAEALKLQLGGASKLLAAKREGTISENQYQAGLAELHVRESPDVGKEALKFLGNAAAITAGLALTAGVAPLLGGAAAVTGGAATATTAAKSIVSGAAPVLKSITQPANVNLISTITKGIGKVDAFSKTSFGSQLIGTLGKVVTNLATPDPGKPSTVPQKLALVAGNVPSFASGTIGQNAVFDGSGVTVSLGKGSASSWWEKNKSWALPVLLAVPGFFFIVFMLLGGRRR